MSERENRDLILTWISGESFCQKEELQVFLKSIKTSGFEGDVVALTDNMPQDFRQKMNNYGYQVVDVNPEKTNVIVMDRFIHFWEFLVHNHDKYEYVYQVDSKDVLFQLNPSKYIRNEILEYINPSGKVIFIPEGVIHLCSLWNNMDQFKFQKHLLPNARVDWQNWPVYNAGTIIGDSRVLKDFNMLVWQTTCRTIFLKSVGTNGSIECFSDQAALNYLYNAHLHKDDRQYASLPVQNQNFCLTGESSFKKYLKKHPYSKDGIIYSAYHDLPYCIVHQWERTEFKEMVLEKYSEKS